MARPIRFLHLSTFYPPWSFGGDAMYIYRLSHALADEGHEVDVVHCLDAYHLLHPEPPDGSFAPHPRVHVHGMRSGLGWLSPLLTHQTGRPALKGPALRALMADRPFDVVHFHNISLLGPDVLTLAPAGATPIKLYTAHEHWLVCPTHVLWKFDRAVCDRPQCLQCTVRAGRPPQLWRYTGRLDRATRHVHRFLAMSHSSAALHAERGFPRPMEVLPNFVERADEDWRHPGAPPQKTPYFLFVGRLEAIKGLHTLLSAWERVEGIDLLVAGTGSCDRQLRAQAAGNPRVRFLGHQSQRALGALYFHATACIVPSLTYETFGIIVIEAFMRKTPVIARALGALTELVEESGGGLLYRSDAELLKAVAALRESPERRTVLGERGYEAYVSRWTREVHLRQYHALLEATASEVLGHVPWRQ